MAEKSQGGPVKEAVQDLPANPLTDEVQNLVEAALERLLASVTDKIDGLTDRLLDYVENEGPSLVSTLIGSTGSGGPLRKGLGKLAGGTLSLMTGGGKGGKGGRSKKLKFTNIVESLDIGAPRRLVYDQWTQFQDFPSFMKKVGSVEQEAEEKVAWKAQIFLSHRNWESTIVEQIPDQRIIWRSKGPKGYVDGAVTFHEIAPDLTRILLALEYHPQGLFERTGNIWRAQGRRVRLEFKHFRRHVMTQSVLHPDEVEGWRGEIRDSQVVKDHETALAEEQEREGAEEEEEKRAEAKEEEPEEERAEEEEEPEEEEEEEEEEEPEEERAEEEEEPEEEEEEEEEEPEEEEEEEEEERPRARARRPARPARGRPREEPEEEPEEEPPSRPVRRRKAAARSA